MAQSSEWLGTTEASQRLGITLRTLYRLIDEGQVRAYKFGRVIRLRTSDVEAFIESSLVEPGNLTHLYPDSKSDVVNLREDAEGETSETTGATTTTS